MSTSLLYAPNVHSGGGLVLLKGVLAAWPDAGRRVAFLDQRARNFLSVPAGVDVTWVLASAPSRLAAEGALRGASHAGDTVLCFHGLPPLLATPAQVVVFQQNRLYLGLTALSQFKPRTAVRLAIERFISRHFRHRVHAYIVQTPTMARDLAHWYGPRCPPIRVLPFIDSWPGRSPVQAREWDFVYVSDGEAHKNHARLLEAWRVLAAEGLKPRLALTLGPRDAALARGVEALRDEYGLQVFNLGHLPRADVLLLYARARALIFPSTSESLGLPLIEASHLGLPIVASELDFVRDVCSPVQTFDPLSAVSIARAVRRFLDVPEPALQVTGPEALWAALATVPTRRSDAS